MRRTALRGHALQYEGRACSPGDEPGYYRLTYSGAGVAYCQCREASPELLSTAARQRWHRDIHKPTIIRQMQAANG